MGDSLSSQTQYSNVIGSVWMGDRTRLFFIWGRVETETATHTLPNYYIQYAQWDFPCQHVMSMSVRNISKLGKIFRNNWKKQVRLISAGKMLFNNQPLEIGVRLLCEGAL